MFEVVRDRHGTLVAATAANFGQFGARVAISPFVLTISAAFGVTKGEIGTVLTLLWASFALVQFPSGVFADRFGERRVIVVALALTTGGSLFLAGAPTFALFALAAVTLGIGTGLYFPVGSALLARQFDRRGRVLGVHSAGAPLAGLALPVGATAVAARRGWRTGVAVGAVASAAALVLAVALVGSTPASDPGLVLRERLRPRSALALLARPGVALTTLVAALGMYAFQSFVSFFPTFLQEYHSFAQGTASLAFGAAFALFAVGLPLVGSVADAYGSTVALCGSFLVAAAGFAALLFSPARPVTYAGVVVVGLGVTWGGALQARFMTRFPEAERASGFGVARTVFVFLGASGNAATGYLAETAGWPVAYGVVVAVLVSAAGLVAGIRQKE